MNLALRRARFERSRWLASAVLAAAVAAGCQSGAPERTSPTIEIAFEERADDRNGISVTLRNETSEAFGYAGEHADLPAASVQSWDGEQWSSRQPYCAAGWDWFTLLPDESRSFSFPLFTRVGDVRLAMTFYRGLTWEVAEKSERVRVHSNVLERPSAIVTSARD